MNALSRFPSTSKHLIPVGMRNLHQDLVTDRAQIATVPGQSAQDLPGRRGLHAERKPDAPAVRRFSVDVEGVEREDVWFCEMP